MCNQIRRLFVSILSVSLGFSLVFPTLTVGQDIIFQDNDSMYGHHLTTPSTKLSMVNPNSAIIARTSTTTSTTTSPPCETQCVTLDFCPELFQLLKNPTAKNLQVLKQASCGFSPEGDPLVKCDDFLCDSRFGKLSTRDGNLTPSANPASVTSPDPESESSSSSRPLTSSDTGVQNNLLRIGTINNPFNSDDCGMAFPDRINGGQSASRGEFPWIVGIALHSSSGPQVICGGALVADDWVLTAAHCVVDSGHHTRNISHVRVGAFNITDTKEAGAEDIEVGKVLFHDQFRERPVVKHDIALLKLKQKVTPGLSIGTICLPNSTSEEVYYDLKSTTTIAGWGSDGSKSGYNLLQKVDIPLVPGDHCKRVFHRVRVRVLPELQICAGATGKDSCKGDSGGPLMSVINGRTVLVGIISFGTVQCDGRLPGVYTKMTSYVDWVRSTVLKES